VVVVLLLREREEIIHISETSELSFEKQIYILIYVRSRTFFLASFFLGNFCVNKIDVSEEELDRRSGAVRLACMRRF
jgi:hypothetical protein